MISQKDSLERKSRFIKATRQFFEEGNFTEIIPPILNTSVPNEPYLFPFTTTWNNSVEENKFYLPTSPERSLKLALASGLGNCFAIGHCFRNLEASSSRHSPEFFMLEWYRENARFGDIMDDIKKYIQFLCDKLNTQHDVFHDISHETNSNSSSRLHKRLVNGWRDPSWLSWTTISIKDVFEEKLKTSYKSLVEEERVLLTVAKSLGYNTHGATWRQIFDQLIVNEVESMISKSPTFLVDFPSRISPLCETKTDETYLAERFELYIGGMEIANGNNENLDVKRIREVFEKESVSSHVPVDIKFLEAIETMKEYGKKFAGVGLGLERLMMVLYDDYEMTGVI